MNNSATPSSCRNNPRAYGQPSVNFYNESQSGSGYFEEIENFDVLSGRLCLFADGSDLYQQVRLNLTQLWQQVKEGRGSQCKGRSIWIYFFLNPYMKETFFLSSCNL